MSSIEREAGDEIPQLGPAAPRGPAGIGGWLLALAVGQVLAALLLPIRVAYEYFNLENQKVFGEFPLAMYGELVLELAQILLVLVTTVLLFRKSRHFPRLAILECVVAPLQPFLAMAWSAFALAHQLGRPIGDFLEVQPQDIRQLLLSVISASIWMAYILRSRRVRNTFILGLSAQDVRGDAALETPLLRAIGGIIVAVGASSIFIGIGLTFDRGVFNGSILGGALQVGLALWLLRGSEVARLLLALLFGIGTVGTGWLVFSANQGPSMKIALLPLVLLFAVIFWFLAFSSRLRAQLEINEAKYAKPAGETVGES